MIEFTPLNIFLDRWTRNDIPIRLTGIDLTGATMEAEFRQKNDTPGAALIALTNTVSPNLDGLRLVSVATVNGVKVSTVMMQLSEATSENPAKLLPANEPGEVVELAWDLHLTPGSALNPLLPFGKRKYLGGTATVRGGTTGVTP